LVDLETGLPLPDGSVGGLFVDATLRRCTDLRVMLHEFTRVLKDGGRVAIKADRLAMSANGVGSRVYVTVATLSDAMSPGFQIVKSRLQGRMGTAFVTVLGSYIKLLSSRVRILAVFLLPLVFMLLPVEIIVGMCLNMLGVFLNYLDRTERNYVSSIVVGRKIEGSPIR